jgi:hypothetical protein
MDHRRVVLELMPAPTFNAVDMLDCVNGHHNIETGVCTVCGYQEEPVVTFDNVQDRFRDDPNRTTAAEYLHETLTYWRDGMIGNATCGNAIAELTRWLQSNKE